MHNLAASLQLLIQGHTETGAYYSVCHPVEETPVEAYLDCSIEQGRPVCCSMMGAFAVWVDGRSWMRYRVADAEIAKNIPMEELLRWNALDTTLAMIWGVTELLDGKRMVELDTHDDENPIILHVDDEGLIRHELEEFDQAFEPIPFLPFARLVLREGEKMHVFSLKMLEAIEFRLAAEPLDSPNLLPLKHRIELIQRWNLENTLLKLRSQLGKHP